MTHKLLLLVRHADAEKNALGQFAGNQASDSLTLTGATQLHRLAAELELFKTELGIESVGLATADSNRARMTADALARFTSSAPVRISGFRSINSGIAAGLTETEIAERHPDFSNALQLYREGVLSSYEIPYPTGAEPVMNFERDVVAALYSYLEQTNEDLRIILGHRSSITAVLLHYARMAHNYPQQFFGFIPLDACLTSCIDITPGGERIAWVNRPLLTRHLTLKARQA